MANYVQEAKDKFYYVYSCELDIPFRIKMYDCLVALTSKEVWLHEAVT